ncbi:hypothetical protein AOQ73_24445 [Bradyrhizobium pachyrhizi]|nr:hypothetical protein AOQ73_24445 [Bradyrhizobium pachyrhizi]
MLGKEFVERASEFIYINVIVARLGRDTYNALVIAILGVPCFRKVQFRFICTLPFTVSIPSPLIGTLGRIKHHVGFIHLNKTHRREAGSRFQTDRSGIDQWSLAIEPKLTFQQNIPRVVDKRMTKPKSCGGCDFSSPGKQFPPLFAFEYLIHLKSSFCP